MVNEQTTGSDGKATFENTEYGDYTLTITADGYTTKTENIAFRSNHKNFSITLVEDTPTGTGTVTVTGVNSQETPITYISTTFLYTGEMPTSEDDSNIVAFGGDGETNVAQLFIYDTSTHQPTDDPNIPFGGYKLYADGVDGGDVYYNGTLTVDGDENVTITLTEQGNTGTVTVTCQDSEQTPLDFANVVLSIDEEHPICGGNTGSDGTVILETLNEQGEPTGTVADVPYGDYLLFGSYYDESTGLDYNYSGALTVDGDETVTITLTQE